MTPAYLRLTRLTLVLCFFLPAALYAGNSIKTFQGMNGYWSETANLTLLAIGLSLISERLFRALRPAIDRSSVEEAAFLDRLPSRWVPWAITASAGASLALELAVIRWQGTVWEVFAFYKNFSLLACFAGLGLGYALAGRDRIPAVMVVPLLAFQMVFLIVLRYAVPDEMLGSLRSTPIVEQLNMGIITATFKVAVMVYYFLGVVLLLTALAFLPVGQLCGRLLGRTGELRAYGLNLLGSIAGVLLMMLLSYLWTAPLIWFVPCLAILVLLQSFRLEVLVAATLAVLAMASVLNWPVDFMVERIYSPYQLIERGYGEHGLTTIQAAGHYYQRILDLSPNAQRAYPKLARLALYYEMPYRLRPGASRVAIVGAGTGNDVAAAVRRGARNVDAIEIDPTIMQIGRYYHPERPYDDPRVHRIVNDARTFLRGTTNQYDLIVYGLLDSHTLLSHASSVRLDSFVYTVEGLRDAHDHLTEDGVVSLSFCVLSPEIGRKIYLMMQEAFGGKPPVCINSGVDGSVIFAQSRNGDLRVDPSILDGKDKDFEDASPLYADPKIHADISTDDWPFFYMPRREYPFSYVGMILLILLLSGFVFGNFLSERPRFRQVSFFFMGAGFMLVETKGITELGLMFGNTWQTIGIVIAAILAMAYLANLAVARLGLGRTAVPLALVLLLASLGAGLVLARAGGLSATPAGQWAAIVVLTAPLFFSGIAFSALLSDSRDISSALAMNLLGAMAGGMLEYNSMYFGFQFLYWLAMALYAGALFTGSIRKQVA